MLPRVVVWYGLCTGVGTGSRSLLWLLSLGNVDWAEANDDYIIIIIITATHLIICLPE